MYVASRYMAWYTRRL